MKTCEKCGSEKLKYAGNDNASGIDKEMYQCQDCGQITFFLADGDSKSACLPSYNFFGELLEEQLAEYQTRYNLLEMTCIDLMKEGKPFDQYAKEAAGYKIMIESIKENHSQK